MPADLVASLASAAAVAEQLDRRMEQLHTKIRGEGTARESNDAHDGVDEQRLLRFWQEALAGSPRPIGHTGPRTGKLEP